MAGNAVFLAGDRLVERNVAHEGATVLLLPHEAGCLEHAKRLAHRPARDAELFGERGFVQLGARRHLAAQDRALDLLLDGGGYDPSLGARPLKRTVARMVGVGGAFLTRKAYVRSHSAAAHK